MEQEAAQELLGRQTHHLGLMAVGIALRVERKLVLGHGHQARIRDGEPMRIATEVAKNQSRATEWPLGVHDPFAAIQRIKQLLKGTRIVERSNAAGKRQLSCL